MLEAATARPGCRTPGVRIRVTSQDASTLMRQAHELQAAGRLNDAIGRYGEAVIANPASGIAAQNLAQALGDAGRWKDALPHAERAATLEPHELAVQMTLAEALLAVGEVGRASDLAGDMRRRWSTNQRAIALQCDAWRLVGDRRYGQLHDYASLIAISKLEAPSGWRSLEAWAGEAAAQLRVLHGDRGCIEVDARDHALGALPRTIDAAVRRHLEKLGSGDDPVRARNHGTYSIQCLWSEMVTSGDKRADRIAQEGWLSAIVCLGATGQLRLGKSGVAMQPRLEAGHVVDPEAGLLVLFPSYIWQGVTLSGGEPCIILHAELVPGPAQLPDHD